MTDPTLESTPLPVTPATPTNSRRFQLTALARNAREFLRRTSQPRPPDAVSSPINLNPQVVEAQTIIGNEVEVDQKAEAEKDLRKDLETWINYSDRSLGKGNVSLREFVMTEEGMPEEAVNARLDEIYSTTAESILTARLTPDSKLTADLWKSFIPADEKKIKAKLAEMAQKEAQLSPPEDLGYFGQWARIVEANQALKESKIETVKNARGSVKGLAASLEQGGNLAEVRGELLDGLDAAWVRPNSRVMRQLKSTLSSEAWHSLYSELTTRIDQVLARADRGEVQPGREAWVASWSKHLGRGEKPESPQKAVVRSRKNTLTPWQKGTMAAGLATIMLSGAAGRPIETALANKQVGKPGLEQRLEQTPPHLRPEGIKLPGGEIITTAPVKDLGSAIGAVASVSRGANEAARAGIPLETAGAGGNERNPDANEQKAALEAANDSERPEPSKLNGATSLDSTSLLASEEAVGERADQARERLETRETGIAETDSQQRAAQKIGQLSGEDLLRAEQSLDSNGERVREGLVSRDASYQVADDQESAVREVAQMSGAQLQQAEERLDAAQRAAVHNTAGIDASTLQAAEQRIENQGVDTLTRRDANLEAVNAKRAEDQVPERFPTKIAVVEGSNFWNSFKVEDLDKQSLNAVRATIVALAAKNGHDLNKIPPGEIDLNQILSPDQLAFVTNMASFVGTTR